MFFIIGNPRSGTSLLRLLLTTNPAIHVPPECGFMAWWAKKYHDVDLANDPSRVEALTDDIVSSKKFEFWDMSREDVAAAIRQSENRDYASLTRHLYTTHATTAGKPEALIGDKNNFHVGHVPQLDSLQPGSKFIHIIRDGRDVAASYMALNKAADTATSQYYPKLAQTIDRAADEWAGNIMTVRRAFAALAQDQCIEIRYEDLVADTVSVLQRVCAFLGVAYDPHMLNYHEHNKAQGLEPAEFGAWKKRTFQAIDASAIGRHGELGEEAIANFNMIAREPLALYGYL
ncbi:MAG: sulfotransferase [Pseudomonadota bacterium]